MAIKEDSDPTIGTYLAPGGEQADLVAKFSEAIRGFHGNPVLRGPDGTEVPVPEELFDILIRATAELQRGRGITIVPNNQKLTTQEAADILGVSRPTLVKILEDGKIPFNTVGRHRRVILSDLMDFRSQQEDGRLAALREVATQTPTDETYYDPSKPTRN